ncbi:hypothetical protein ACFT7S_20705 [Streptomyces sp. NPDC057136]|uniref:hypothetical protein n=1 Tax=Streptomyces sp. NPDC057136 TaxID=3346029 RepID=UPI003639DDA7
MENMYEESLIFAAGSQHDGYELLRQLSKGSNAFRYQRARVACPEPVVLGEDAVV